MPDIEQFWPEIDRITQERGARAWLRSRPTGQRLALAVACAAALAAAGALHLRPDWGTTARAPLFASVALYGLGLLVCLALLLGSMGRPRASRVAAVGIGVVWLVAPFAVAALPAARFVHVHEDDFAQAALGCLIYGAVLALPLLFMLRALDRLERVSAPGLVLMATAAGLVGNAALLLHCPIDDSRHLVLGHATVGVTLAAIGAVTIGAWRSVRRSTAAGAPSRT